MKKLSPAIQHEEAALEKLQLQNAEAGLIINNSPGKEPAPQFDTSTYLDELPCIIQTTKLSNQIPSNTNLKSQQFREEQLQRASRNEQAMVDSYSFEAEPKIETAWFWGYENKKGMDCKGKEPMGKLWPTDVAKRGRGPNDMGLMPLQQPYEVPSLSAGVNVAEEHYQKKISQMQRSIDNAKIYLEALQEANRVYTNAGTLRQSAEVLRQARLAVKAAERAFVLVTSLLTEGLNVNDQEEDASTLLYASSLELWKARATMTRQTSAARVLQRTIKLWHYRPLRLIPCPK